MERALARARPVGRQGGGVKSCGAHLCDAQSLDAQSSDTPSDVASFTHAIVKAKIMNRLAQYQADFHKARQAARAEVNRLKSECPDDAADVEQLFERHDFRAIKIRVQQLDVMTTPSPLRQLTQAVLNAHEQADATNYDTALEDQLRQQALDILKGAGISASEQMPGESTTPLRAARAFQDASIKRRAQQMVVQAIEAGPENLGPLNTEGLVIRTLSAMRAVSPTYVARMVTHLDTLLWLERAGADQGRRRR